MKKGLIGLLLACAAATVYAEVPRVRLYTNVGYGLGGDTLLSGQYIGGSGFRLRTGQGPVLAVGADIRLADRLTLQGSLGYQRDSMEAANGNVSFHRWPVELLGFYSINQQVRVGMGVRKTQNVKVKAEGVGAGIDIEGSYNSSAGAVLEVQYLFDVPATVDRKLIVGMHLRYVQESFTQEDSGTGPKEKKKGNHVALGLVFYY
jgi:hypothetical protein